MPILKPFAPSAASDLSTSIGLLATVLESSASSAVTVGYITAICFFLAYNTFYKAVDMSALYALKYAEALKIPAACAAVVAVGLGLTRFCRMAARGLTNVGGAVASTGWIVGGAVAKMMALPEDLICSNLFKRQCPQTAELVKGMGEEVKRPLLEEMGEEVDEVV